MVDVPVAAARDAARPEDALQLQTLQSKVDLLYAESEAVETELKAYEALVEKRDALHTQIVALESEMDDVPRRACVEIHGRHRITKEVMYGYGTVMERGPFECVDVSYSCEHCGSMSFYDDDLTDAPFDAGDVVAYQERTEGDDDDDDDDDASLSSGGEEDRHTENVPFNLVSRRALPAPLDTHDTQ